MSNPIRLDSELIAAAQRESLVKKRSVPKQIEFWATLGKTLQNVLDYSDIITVLQGMKKITVESVESGTADPKAVFASPDRAVLQRRIQGGWMTRQKQLWFPAGGKGAGRPTFYGLFLEPRGVKLVNADLIAKIINPETPSASTVVFQPAFQDLVRFPFHADIGSTRIFLVLQPVYIETSRKRETRQKEEFAWKNLSRIFQ